MRGVRGEETNLSDFGIDDDARGAAGIHHGGAGGGSDGDFGVWSEEESPQQKRQRVYRGRL